MSLWLDSLLSNLHGYGNDPEKRAKCILAHLSMSVPRSWWERALETGRIDDSYIQILQELYAELQAVPVLTGRVEVAALVALAFADDEAEEREPKFGTVYSQHTIEEYLSRAKEVMKSRPAIRKLREMIARNAGFPA